MTEQKTEDALGHYTVVNKGNIFDFTLFCQGSIISLKKTETSKKPLLHYCRVLQRNRVYYFCWKMYIFLNS